MSENLVQRIESLQTISAQLEPEENLRKHYLDEVSQLSGQFLNTLDDLPTYRAERERQGVFKMDGKPVPVSELLDIYSREIIHKGIKPASAGHIGYIPGGGIYTSALADYLSDVTNVYSGIYYAGPGAVALENELLDWLKGVFGFPDTAVGNFTSGGSIANLIALTAARDKHGIKSGKIEKSVIYLSDQVHHCIFKALRIIGLEDVILRSLELDENSRIRVSGLRTSIAADLEKGLNPFMVIASAGTTDTGAIDPLEEIGQTAAQHGLWFHVDAAYGGFFILTESRKTRFRGIERADSLVMDPHKGLFLPYGLGAVLVKDREAVFHSHHYQASYMQDALDQDNLISPADVSPELTRPFRGLRLWIPLKLHGIEPFIACLEEKLLLTVYFRQKLVEMGFEVGPEPDLSVSYFWFPAKNTDQNLFNRKLMEAIHRDGEIFLSSTTINGRFVIRIALLSFRTKLHTIDKAVAMIRRAMVQVAEQNN
jgi:glutamate/tyrosine decarboxylase-like PLP-dependent enzyme